MLGYFCIILQGKEILEKLILSVPITGRAIFYNTLPRGYISQYSPGGKYWMFCALGYIIVQEGNIERDYIRYANLFTVSVLGQEEGYN